MSNRGHKLQLQLIILFALLLLFSAAEAVTDFVYNGFDGAELWLSGMADVKQGVLRLTNTTSRKLGHAFYAHPVQFSDPDSRSFSSTFVFSIKPRYPKLGGHGLALVMAPTRNLPGAVPSNYLGILSPLTNNLSSNHIFFLEFDTVQDFEFFDMDDNHVGVNLNSMASQAAATVAERTGPAPSDSKRLTLISGVSMQAWVAYDGRNDTLSVWMAPAGSARPEWPLLRTTAALKRVLPNTTYVGISASTGLLSSAHHVYGWSFTANASSFARDLDVGALPSLAASANSRQHVVAAAAAALTAAVVVVAAVLAWRAWRGRERIEDWELRCGPHRFRYRELSAATQGFSDSHLLGLGGFGRVYRGTLPSTGAEIAVKRVAHDSKQGLREFLAEVGSIGRLRHRNLVPLLGWCRLRDDLLLVYEYMFYGSLDKLLFHGAGGAKRALTWTQRYDVVKGVAAGLLYLHEEWEQRVVHRDVKSSNVLLDAAMNARLGDFGLARLYEHGASGQGHTTKVVGTLGYLAPELARTGRATAASDVFSFGTLLLEVASGRRPVDVCGSGELLLLDWVWALHARGRALEAVDPLLDGDFDSAQALLLLKLGLLCSHEEPEKRPTMRQVVHVLAGDLELPPMRPDYAVDSPLWPPPPAASPASMAGTDRTTTTVVGAQETVTELLLEMMEKNASAAATGRRLSSSGSGGTGSRHLSHSLT